MKSLAEKAEQEGGYQDIEINGNTIFKGKRDCSQRWNLIKRYFPPGKMTILDIGSHYGYFPLRIAERGHLVWSIDNHRKRLDIQKAVIRQSKQPNIFPCFKEMGLIDFLELARTTEAIDCLMMMSVIHYFKLEEIPEIIEAISRITPLFILEVPSKQEKFEPAQKLIKNINFTQLLSFFFEEVDVMWSAPACGENAKRRMYICRNKDLHKRKLTGYLGGEFGRHHYLDYWENGRWALDEDIDITKGFNLHNLLKFGLEDDNVVHKAAKKYYEIIKQRKGEVTDVSLRNVIITPEPKIIDTNEGLGGNDKEEIYGMKWNDYVKKMKSMSVEELQSYLMEKFEQST